MCARPSSINSQTLPDRWTDRQDDAVKDRFSINSTTMRFFVLISRPYLDLFCFSPAEMQILQEEKALIFFLSPSAVGDGAKESSREEAISSVIVRTEIVLSDHS